MRKYNIGIVGATGIVGQAFLKAIDIYNIEYNELKLFASPSSKGKIIVFQNKEYTIQTVDENSFKDIDIALFSCGAKLSRLYAPFAKKYNCLVIDNSSAFRHDKRVPLIVPEINKEDIFTHQGIISNPNCSAIQSTMVIKALLDEYKIRKVNFVTLQAVSGSGQKGINDYVKNEANFYPYHIRQTCIPEIDLPAKDEYTKEEIKMVEESRRILHLPKLKISATCIRVPILNSHSIVINLTLNKNFTLSQIKNKLANFENIVVIDDIHNHLYPITSLSNGNARVYVGRIRKDSAQKNGLILYCVADNIVRGAAANAILILKHICTQA